MPRSDVESITDFSGMLNTADGPSELQPNEAAIAQNVVATGKGKVQKRFGFDIVSSGGAGSGVRGLLTFQRLVGERKYLLIANNANIYTITPDDTTWRNRGAYGTDAGERVNGVVSDNIAIFGNGNANNVVKKLDEVEDQSDTVGGNTDSIATSIAETATEKKTITAITAGEDIISIDIEVNNKGTGDWTVTLHDASNNVLATATLLNANITNSAFNTFTFSTPYTADGNEDHFHVTATVAGGSAVSSSANDLETVSYKLYVLQVATLGGSPPNASIFEKHKGFTLLSGVTTSPTVVYWSNVNAPETWSSGVAGSESISLNDGQKITRVISQSSGDTDESIIIFKERQKHNMTPVFASSVSALADEDELGFKQGQINDKSGGTMAGNSAVQVGKQGIMFLGENKFQSFGFVENYPGFRLPSHLSEKIEPTVKLINKNKINLATAIHDEFNNVYRCAAPTGVNPFNNIEFVYDLRFGEWSINTGLSPSAYAIFENSAGDRSVYFGSEHTGTVYRFNKRFSDNYDTSAAEGSAIDSIWRSRTFRYGNSKLFRRNRFDRVIVKGLITNPFSGDFTIVVKNRKQDASYTKTITNSDILGPSSVSGYIGDDYVGIGYVGDGGASTGEPNMYRFEVEIPFPPNVKEGNEVYFVMRNNKDGQGYRIEEITFYFDEIPSKPLTPST